MFRSIINWVKNLFHPPFRSAKLNNWKEGLYDAKRRDFLEKHYEGFLNPLDKDNPDAG